VELREIADVELREIADVQLREVADVQLREVADVQLREVADVELREISARVHKLLSEPLELRRIGIPIAGSESSPRRTFHVARCPTSR